MRMWVWSLASISGLRIQRFHRLQRRSQIWLDLVLPWLWLRHILAAAQIQPLAWELSYIANATIKIYIYMYIYSHKALWPFEASSDVWHTRTTQSRAYPSAASCPAIPLAAWWSPFLHVSAWLTPPYLSRLSPRAASCKESSAGPHPLPSILVLTEVLQQHLESLSQSFTMVH